MLEDKRKWESEGVRKGDGVECWKIKENGSQRGSGREMVWSDGR